MRVVVALLVSLAVAFAISSDRTVVYERHAIPPMWSMVGFAAPDAQIKFIVALNQQNLDVLDQKFWAVSDPKSPEYQNFLTPEEVLAIIAPVPAEKEAVRTWLIACGCPTVEDLGDALSATVSVKMAETIFQTKFYTFRHTERQNVIIRQMGTYSIPAEIVPLVVMITGVADFPVLSSPKIYSPSPLQSIGIIPATLQEVYEIPAGQSAAGSNQGVAEFQSGDYYDPAGLQSFAQQVGVTIAPLDSKHIVTPLPPEGIEGDLDIQYIAAIGTGATNWYWTEANWLYDWSVTFFGASARPDIISISYGWWEGDQCTIDPTECSNLGVNSTVYVQRVNTEFQKIGTVGVSILSASGDSGANGRTDPDCTVPQLRPAYPASSPYLTSVGATQLVNPETNLTAQPPVCTSGSWSCASGGQETAVSFDQSSFASGGGFSDIASRPSYQDAAVKAYFASGVKLPGTKYYNANGRGLPDVASLGSAILIYSDSLLGGVGAVGGTSASSPSFAGYMSLLNAVSRKKTGKPLGFLNPFLYQMYAEHPAAFRDITVGDNICTEDGCASTCEGFYCAKGWDPVTGLGVANVKEMLAYLNTVLDAKVAATAYTTVIYYENCRD